MKETHILILSLHTIARFNPFCSSHQAAAAAAAAAAATAILGGSSTTSMTLISKEMQQGSLIEILPFRSFQDVRSDLAAYQQLIVSGPKGSSKQEAYRIT